MLLVRRRKSIGSGLLRQAVSFLWEVNSYGNHPVNAVAHQPAIHKIALSPGVFLGERISPVTFHIADSVLEHIGRSIDGKRSIHPMTHTENVVSALHEGNISERPHDVILDWRERAKPNGTGGKEAGCLNVKCNAIFCKSIPGNVDLAAFPVKIRAGV